LAAHDACVGLTPAEVAALEGLLELREFRQGDFIVRAGDAADALFLLTRGRVSVTIDTSNGRVKRLSTLSAGMAFGDLAVVNRGPRSADVRADTPVACYALSLERFDTMTETHPRLKVVILQNLLRNVGQMLSRANRELATFAG